MNMLTMDYIRNEVADTDIIYKRGERLFEYGACSKWPLAKRLKPARHLIKWSESIRKPGK